MDIKKKIEKLTYRGIEISYSVYGGDKKYSASATITVHRGNYTSETPLLLDRNFETLESAEKEVINLVQLKIDESIDT